MPETSSRFPAKLDPELLDRLEKAWAPARAAGFMGAAPLEELRLHAFGYLMSDWREQLGGQYVDCGAGAGVLGVFLALELPTSRWRLVDASRRRCELAERAVAAADLRDRVAVEHARVEDVARGDLRGTLDGVVARSFGPVAELAECALPLLDFSGTLVVSVSTATLHQWQALPLVERTGCSLVSIWSTPHGRFLSVERIGPIPSELPRRPPARRRAPLGGR